MSLTIGQDGSRPQACWVDSDSDGENDCKWQEYRVFTHADGVTSLNPQPEATLGLTASSSSLTGVVVPEEADSNRREQLAEEARQAHFDEEEREELVPQRATPEVGEVAPFDVAIHCDDHSLVLNERNADDIISILRVTRQRARTESDKGSLIFETQNIVRNFVAAKFLPFPTEKRPAPQSRNLCFSFAHGRTCCVHYATGKCTRGPNKCKFLHTDIPTEVVDLLNTLQ